MDQLFTQGSTMGLSSVLRTGSPVIDMLICVSIPLIFRGLWTLYERHGHNFSEWSRMLFSGNEPKRTIEYELKQNMWGDVVSGGRDTKNQLLQKAITLKLGNMREEIMFHDAHVNLTELQDKHQYHWERSTTTVEQLRKYHMILSTPPGMWVCIRKTKDGTNLYFKQTTSEDERGGENSKVQRKTFRFHFKASGPSGERVLDDFIQEAYDEYVAKVEAEQDDARYLYIMRHKPLPAIGNDGEEAKKDSGHSFKRYKLSERKTFDSLFFEGKDMLLRLLAQFEQQTGKYAVPGYPHKLGLLLHGPPGTGKTSLIKALAQWTKRSVVSIPLSKIRTNQELMDLVYDQSYAVAGVDVPIKMGFKETIFVMEDVDAASNIVHRRDKPESTTKVTKIVRETSVAGAGEEKTVEESETVESGQGKAVKIKREKSVTGEVSGAAPAAVSESPQEVLGMDDETALMLGTLMSMKDSKSGGTGWRMGTSSSLDKLDLSGVLNVIDGIVDTDGRILILTTNHPELLDPALIRPGRVDKKLYLGYMSCENAQKLIAHYFQRELTPEEVDEVEAVFDAPPGSAQFTPAVVEQLCAEHDTVSSLVLALREKLRPVAPGGSELPSLSGL